MKYLALFGLTLVSAVGLTLTLDVRPPLTITNTENCILGANSWGTATGTEAGLVCHASQGWQVSCSFPSVASRQGSYKWYGVGPNGDLALPNTLTVTMAVSGHDPDTTTTVTLKTTSYSFNPTTPHTWTTTATTSTGHQATVDATAVCASLATDWQDLIPDTVRYGYGE